MQSLAAARVALARGELSSVALVSACLEQIARCDPQVRAWVKVDAAGALAAARAADAAAQAGDVSLQAGDVSLQADDVSLQAGGWRGPLHGIPLGVKDIVDVASWPTLAGSALRQGHVARDDAAIVARLRAAGGIVLGKTVTTPWACFDPPPTRNPWNLAHTPGGSSSGSAAAVALGMCFAALGSQTGGSIIRPASYCGVVGFKPSWGALDVRGVVPVAPSLDHLGWMARSVGDVDLVYRATVDRGAPVPASPVPASPVPASPVPASPVPVSSVPVSSGAARASHAPRVGVVREYYWQMADAEVCAHVEAAIACWTAAGATVLSAALPAAHEQALVWHQCIMAFEAAQYHRAIYAMHRAQFGPRMQELLDEGLAVTAEAYQAARTGQAPFRAAVHQALQDFDLLVTPATPTAAPADLTTTGSALFNRAWSYAGVPVVSLPVGLTSSGLPVAAQLIGRYAGDFQLLDAAAWCEQALGGRMPALPGALGGA